LGHVFNAPDHYGSIELETRDTEYLNKAIVGNYKASNDPAYIPESENIFYNQYCIYGEDDIPGKDADLTLTLCDGCRYQIRTYVSKLINGTEQIG
jgi:hypothetical protein